MYHARSSAGHAAARATPAQKQARQADGGMSLQPGRGDQKEDDGKKEEAY